MAKTATEAAGTSGSQFFVVTGEDAGLPPDYALLGEVTEGMDVVDLIGVAPVGAGRAADGADRDGVRHRRGAVAAGTRAPSWASRRRLSSGPPP